MSLLCGFLSVSQETALDDSKDAGDLHVHVEDSQVIKSPLLKSCDSHVTGHTPTSSERDRASPSPSQPNSSPTDCESPHLAHHVLECLTPLSHSLAHAKDTHGCFSSLADVQTFQLTVSHLMKQRERRTAKRTHPSVRPIK